jgi:hypothetical protein
MFTQTTTHTDGTTVTGTATEAHVVALLRRALRRRNVTVEATRTGGVIIVRKVWTGDVLPKTMTITCEPVTPVGRITPTMRADLADLDARGGAYRVTAAEPEFRSHVGRTYAGLTSIPPATSARLIDRGLVGVGAPYSATSNGWLPETRVPVRVTLASRLAMLADDHRTHTNAPAGYVHASDHGSASAGRQTPGGALVYDRISTAGCTCGAWSATVEGRDEARGKAREHRQAAAAAFVRALP